MNKKEEHLHEKMLSKYLAYKCKNLTLNISFSTMHLNPSIVINNFHFLSIVIG